MLLLVILYFLPFLYSVIPNLPRRFVVKPIALAKPELLGQKDPTREATSTVPEGNQRTSGVKSTSRVKEDIIQLLYKNMNLSNNNSFENIYRILAVGFVWLFGAFLTSGSYKGENAVIPKSKYQPPGWVFGLVWTIIYVGYAIAWVYVITVIKDNRPVEDKRFFDFIFSIGLIFNFLWSVVIALGSHDILDKNVAFYISVGILIILFIFSIYVIYLLNSEVKSIQDNYFVYWLCVGVFGLYAIWMLIATFLSISGKTHSVSTESNEVTKDVDQT